MKVYLAAAYSRRAELGGYRDQLEAAGVTVTAEWLAGPDQRLINGHVLDAATEAEIETRRFETERSREYAAMCATQDLNDVTGCDVLVMFTGGGRGGGRHIESGYAMALGKPVVLVGARENVFHCLPNVWQFDEWDDAYNELLAHAEAEVVA